MEFSRIRFSCINNVNYRFQPNAQMKLQQMKNGQYFVCLPRQIVRAKGWKKQDDLKVEIGPKGNIVLRK
jgi:hypothetical protein